MKVTNHTIPVHHACKELHFMLLKGRLNNISEDALQISYAINLNDKAALISCCVLLTENFCMRFLRCVSTVK